MTTTVNAESVETVSEEPVPAHSKKREFAASAAAGIVTVVLGLAASGIIEKAALRVRNRIAPKPEKTEDE